MRLYAQLIFHGVYLHRLVHIVETLQLLTSSMLPAPLILQESKDGFCNGCSAYPLHILLPIINHNFNKMCYRQGSFLNQNTRNSKLFLLAVNKSHLSTRNMTHTVQLLRHEAISPIKAEIRAVDSQSDLRILL